MVTKEIIMLICAAVCVLGYVITSLILGKKISLKDMISIKEYILSILPKIVQSVEGLQGSDVKKETAISVSMSYVQDRFGTLKEKDLKKLVAFTGSHIEEILKTPQKKDS